MKYIKGMLDEIVFSKSTGADSEAKDCYSVVVTKESNGYALWDAIEWDDGPVYIFEGWYYSSNDAIVDAVRLWLSGSEMFYQKHPDRK